MFHSPAYIQRASLTGSTTGLLRHVVVATREPFEQDVHVSLLFRIALKRFVTLHIIDYSLH